MASDQREASKSLAEEGGQATLGGRAVKRLSVRGAVRYVIVALTLVLFVFALRKASQQIDIFALPHPIMLVPAFGLFLVHYWLQALGWHLILRSLGLKVSLNASQRMWFSSLMARWVPGPFIYSIARMFIAKENGLNLGVVAYAIVLELTYIVVGAVIATTAFMGGLGSPQNAGELSRLGFIGAVVIAIALVICFRPGILRRIILSPMAERIAAKLTKRQIDLPDIRPLSLTSTLLLLVFYTGFWVYSGFILMSLAAVLGEVHAGQAPAFISAFAGSWFIGFLAILPPAGVGVREVAIYAFLQSTMPSAQVIVLAILMRLWMLITEITVVGVAAGLGVIARRPAAEDRGQAAKHV